VIRYLDMFALDASIKASRSSHGVLPFDLE